MSPSPGRRFRHAMETSEPLQIVGAVNAYAALMATNVGFKALYLSGAGVANISYGLPDVGLTTLDNVLEDTRRITERVDTPLLVDIDTGWGSPQMIARTIKLLIRAQAAGVHIEDQVFAKRCGHLPGKVLVSTEEMVERIQAATDAKSDPDFVLMARTDAFTVEGLESTIERGLAYKEAGAEMLFAEAVDSLDHYQKIKNAVGLPLLANLTEFGQTPLFSLQELAKAGVDMVLYPLSASRAMQRAALNVYREILDTGSQKGVLEQMQTRNELYKFLEKVSHG